MSSSTHSELILDQFTRQAIPFATAASIQDEAALRPGGTVLVVDAAPAPEKADAFNRMERLRDPSHARALPLGEHLDLFRRAGLPAPRVAHHRPAGELRG